MRVGQNSRDRTKPSLIALRHAGAVVVGIVYVYGVSLLFALATESSMLATTAAISTGAAIQLLIICELSQRFSRYNAGQQRYALSTVILLITGLSIYLAAIGCLVRTIPDEFEDGPTFVLDFWIAAGFFFMLISTIVLICFAEALVWTGVSMAKWRSPRAENVEAAATPRPRITDGGNAERPLGDHTPMADSRIVADGAGRAIKGSREQIAQLTRQINSAVESEYASLLAGAGALRRVYLLYRMRREIKRRIEIELEKIAPSGGLYMNCCRD